MSGRPYATEKAEAPGPRYAHAMAAAEAEGAVYLFGVSLRPAVAAAAGAAGEEEVGGAVRRARRWVAAMAAGQMIMGACLGAVMFTGAAELALVKL